jgi:hypothetical protein
MYVTISDETEAHAVMRELIEAKLIEHAVIFTGKRDCSLWNYPVGTKDRKERHFFRHLTIRKSAFDCSQLMIVFRLHMLSLGRTSIYLDAVGKRIYSYEKDISLLYGHEYHKNMEGIRFAVSDCLELTASILNAKERKQHIYDSDDE